MNPGLARVYRFMGLTQVEATGRGATVIDAEGVEYLDCTSGYGVMNQGYLHPRIVAAAREQLERMAMSSRVMLQEAPIALAEYLAQITPGDLTYSFFVNSGAEAVETALKLARAATGRVRWVSTTGAFHGKTLGALSVSGRPLYQDPFRPLLADVVQVPYGNLAALEAVLDERVAAVIVEPIQGEGGVVVPPDDYLPGIRRACDRVGALFIADEVQTGIGRTGYLFAVEAAGVVPDLLCLAKALGGGVVPIGAVVGRPQAWRMFDEHPLLHTSTFGGNPLAARVALEALRVTVEEGLAERARQLGGWFLPALAQVGARYPDLVAAVRGRGLMVGVEFRTPGVAAAVMTELFARRILVVYTLNNERVIRVMPPLVVAKADLERVVACFDEALSAVAAWAADLEEGDPGADG
ncbi:MAG: aspartate aminotransferase family protein [Firmicutes bacterium]|nr:aspartate aminotransferase family protein [Alicyclobacillaceae bacterium]MCL6496779.1 aspartate aminotransferase family protein [Bacillota bacterium]